MNMKKLMYFFAIVTMAVLAQSCEPTPNLSDRGAITGVVTDATTGEPIVGCEVYLSRHTPAQHMNSRTSPVEPEMVVTDSLGKYEFTHLYLGTYSIAALAGGYLPSDNVEVLLTTDNDADWIEVNFELVKAE